jgi:hypothetical protein
MHQTLAHVFEQFRIWLGRILADLTRRYEAFVVHPGDDLATLRVLGVT